MPKPSAFSTTERACCVPFSPSADDPACHGRLIARTIVRGFVTSAEPVQCVALLIGNCINSEEFRLFFGRPTNTEFTRIVYMQMLGRKPSLFEEEWQTSIMDSAPPGTDPRVIMVRNTLLTPEAIQQVESGALVLLIYHALLLREANPAEVAAVERDLAEGRTLAAVVGEISASAEFTALFR